MSIEVPGWPQWLSLIRGYGNRPGSSAPKLKPKWDVHMA